MPGFMFAAFLLLFSIPSPLLRDKLSVPERLSTTRGSVTERQIIWKTTVEMIKKSAFAGVGIGQFKLKYLTAYSHLPPKIKKLAYTQDFPKQNPTEAHNEYLQMFAELGIAGLFAFVWLLTYIFLLGMKCLHTEENSYSFLFYAAAQSSFLSFCIMSFFSFPFHLPQTLALFSLVSSILVSHPETKKETIQKSPLRIQHLLMMSLCMILTFLVSVMSLNMYRSSVALRKGRTALSLHDFHAAKKYLAKARALSPSDGEAQFYYGVFLFNTKKFRQSYKTFKKASQTTSNLNLDMALAKSALLSGKLSEAEEEYKFVLSFYPWKEYQCACYTDLADIYMKLKQAGKALASTRRAHEFCSRGDIQKRNYEKMK